MSKTIDSVDPVAARIEALGTGVTDLLTDADTARASRDGAEVEPGAAAWNHFTNIPTFYNWNNRPS